MEDYQGEIKKLQFCPYCGSKLENQAKFCTSCGSQIAFNIQKDEFDDNPINQKVVYEGKVHKCPNCGDLIDSFHAICPTCGYEIRNAKSSSVVREFAEKLELISSQKMPPFEEKRSIMKKMIGRDFKDKDEAAEALSQFEKQKNEEKASLIINFSVPNTKEDIMEFMILASSNIDLKKGTDDIVTKAWISKLDQVYKRAEISLRKNSDFVQIKNIYESKKTEIKKQKTRGIVIGISLFGIYLFMMGLLWNVVATLIISVIVILLIIGGYFFITRK